MADNYWQEQQAKNQSMQKSEEELNESFKKYYATESEKLSQEIASYYGKYGVDNVIEYWKLLENLSDSERQLLFEDYDAFADKYPEYADLLPVRESIYKLNRAEGLKTSILLQQLEIGAIENSELQEHFEKMASLFAESSANFLVIDKNIARLAVGQAWFEETDFSSRIWSNRQALAKTLQSDFLNGIIRGDDYKTITRNVQDRLERVSKRDIERLIFTEDTYLANEAAMQTYVNDSDFQEYEYMIADGRACDICASLDGQKFKIDERSPGVNFPTMHPWCRCTFVPVYSGSSSEKAKYFLKSGLTSESEGGIIELESDTVAREDQRYGRNKDTLVNKIYIESGEYRRKFDKISENEVLNRNIYQKAKEALQHRSGTEYEDMFWFDVTSGNVILEVTDSSVKRAIVYTNRINNVIKDNNEIVTLHTHPSSMPPSVSDFNSCYRNHYKKGIIACHDGKIFVYTAKQEVNETLYDMYIRSFIDDGYSVFDSQVKALDKLKQNYDIEFWEVK